MCIEEAMIIEFKFFIIAIIRFKLNVVKKFMKDDNKYIRKDKRKFLVSKVQR